jgi:F-type H+-transporting ATPase subunit c
MSRSILRVLGLAVAVLLTGGAPLFAADPTGITNPTFYGAAMGAGIGAALTIVGAGYGFGKIGSAALESMARQPEVAADVGRNMLTIAALLEGATFFSLIVCIIMAFKA